MSIYKDLIEGEFYLSVVGLGYVGMPIAVAFSKKVKVVGFDTNEKKIEQYKLGVDSTKEVGGEVIKASNVFFTNNEEHLKKAMFHIVAVPTPVKSDHTPNLGPIESASRILGRNLQKGSIVVYESTVYPGVTEEICVPILEKVSGLKCGLDFKIGYSPERINPGDSVHRLETIVKIVSGMDSQTLNEIAQVYELVVEAGVFRASSIKVAEAAKVIENSQRDINIAFMNELSIIFNRMGIDTKAVLDAAGTKWNFLKFAPGLVGGHCIGVDPYYLTYKSEQLGYQSRIILSGRRINDEMGKYVAETIVKKLISVGLQVNISKVALLGFTFKEDCPDVRNTKVIDIYNELVEYGINPLICDPVADQQEANQTYGISLCPLEKITSMDCVVVAVAHKEFTKFDKHKIDNLFKAGSNTAKVIIDVKSILNRDEFLKDNYCYWSL